MRRRPRSPEPVDYGPDAVREAVELPARVYERHGPMLRAVAEAAAADESRAALQAALRSASTS